MSSASVTIILKGLMPSRASKKKQGIK